MAAKNKIEDIDIFPFCEQKKAESLRFKKLNKEQKEILKSIILSLVSQHWKSHHQIPFADSYSKLKKRIIKIYEEELGILLKDETEFKCYLHDTMIVFLNKKLKEEK